MGSVKGLLEFFQYKNQLKTRHLHKSNLIIDGDSLAEYVYQKTNSKYPQSDCLLIYVQIKNILKQLRACQIKPLVIFNGINKSRYQKYDINHSRFQKLKHANKKHLSPLLLTETLKATLRKFKIKQYTSEVESVHEIVLVANQIQASVLSSNYEFLIYPIEKGFIPFQSLKNNLVQSKSIFFNSKIYKLNCKLFNCFDIKINWYKKFKPQYLPLLATLCGNELVNPKLLKPLYQKLNILKLTKLEKMNYLFNLLNTKSNLKLLLKFIRSYLKGHLKLRKLINVSLQEYTIPKIKKPQNNIVQIKLKALKRLPVQISDYLVNGYLSPTVFNGFVSGSVYLTPVIKLSNTPSVYELTRNIRRDVYCSLMQHFPDFNRLIEYNKSNSVPQMITRSDLNLYELTHPTTNPIKISSLKEYLLSLLREYLKVKMKNDKINNIWIIKLIWWILHYEYYYTLSKSKLSSKSPKLKIKFNELEYLEIVNFLNEFKLFYFYYNQLILLKSYNRDDLTDFIIAPFALFNESWTLIFLNVDIENEYELCEYLSNGEVNYRSELMKELLKEYIY